MATILQLRRGTTAQHSTFAGAEGEVTVDITKDTIVVHDGVTNGGFALARESAIANSISLTDLSGGTGLDYNSSTGVFDIDSTVATKNYVDSAIQTKDNSDEITEGSTNLYFTNARARGAVSVTDSGGDGSLAYNSTTGVFTYTGPSAADVRAHFSAGTGITITDGAVAVDTTIATKTYADSAATTAVAAVIDAAPATLDTLNELAAALGDDANFSTTITTSIGTKLNSSAVSVFGLTLIDDADAATARTTLGLGTAATTSATAYATAAQGTKADNALPAASYTAADVLTKIKTVDGAGSGLDADLLDGESSAYYATAASVTSEASARSSADTALDGRLTTAETKLSGIEAGATADQTAAEILTAIKTVDGAGSGLDADLLDGLNSTAFATAAQGTKADAALPAASVSVFGGTLIDDADAATARTTLGLGTAATTASTAYATAAQGTLATNALPAASYTAADVLTKIKTVDGTGSGLDADLLDGQSGSYYTGYTDTAIANLVDTAPATLDTLNELAAALGDDPNFATTISTSIGTKLNSSAVSAFGLTLIDDADAATARTTLGLGTAATTASTAYATAAQGTLATNALPAASYTAADVLTKIKTVDGAGSGLDADLLDGLNSTAFATAAQGTKADAALPAASVSVFGGTLIDDADAATARTTLGLGTAATTAATAYATAAQGTKADNALPAASVSAFGLTLVDDLDAATARTTLGLGTAATTASTAYATSAQGTLATNALPAASYTAADVLTKLKTVDGSGSGLDADLLDGNSSSYFRINIYDAAGTLLN